MHVLHDNIRRDPYSFCNVFAYLQFMRDTLKNCVPLFSFAICRVCSPRWRVRTLVDWRGDKCACVYMYVKFELLAKDYHLCFVFNWLDVHNRFRAKSKMTQIVSKIQTFPQKSTIRQQDSQILSSKAKLFILTFFKQPNLRSLVL